MRLKLAAVIVLSVAAQLPSTLLLSGLKPNAGPADGGTRVQLKVEGLPKEQVANLFVSLQAVHSVQSGQIGYKFGEKKEVSIPLEPAGSNSDDLFFVTPNCSKVFGSSSGAVLVTLGEVVGSPEFQFLAGPLLFTLTEPLALLAPAWASPCCAFKLSGGEALILVWDLSRPPSHLVLLRFLGESGHEQEVEGELLLGQEAQEAILSSSGRSDFDVHARKATWCVRGYTPSWPKAEGQVELQVSWNGQQFSRFETFNSFEEEKSLFGDVVEGITEDHLAQAAVLEPQPLAAPDAAVAAGFDYAGAAKVDFEETVSVVQGQEEESLPQPGHGPDMGHAVLLDREGDAFILSRSKDLSYLQEDMRLIHDLFILTFAATVGGAVACRARAPSIIGYIVGGVIVGPGTLNGVQELVQVESVAQLGVCMLLFFLGLELSWDELLANTRAAVAGILGMFFVCGAIVLFAVYCTQTPIREALCIGLFASLASTPVSLQGIREVHHPEPESKEDASDEAQVDEHSTILAVLVAQDVALALLLALVPYVLRPEPSPGARHKGTAAAETSHELYGKDVHLLPFATLLVVACLFAGRRRSRLRERLGAVLQRLRQWLLSTDNEGFTLFALSFSFILAYTSDRLGLSLELGAFLGGLAVAGLSEDVALRTLRKLEGLKETFLAWFFASVGLVVSPRFLLDNLGAVLSVVAFTFILKLFCGFIPLWLLAPRSARSPAVSSLRASWVLAHVSEFGFVLAAKGASWGALSRHAYLLLVGANALSLCLAPWQFWMRDLVLPLQVPLRRSSSSKEISSSTEDTTGHSSPSPHLRLGNSRSAQVMKMSSPTLGSSKVKQTLHHSADP